jgi:hypothetical protein
MIAKVCRNCLKPLAKDRKDLTQSTCFDCNKAIVEAKRKAQGIASPQASSPLAASMLKEIERQEKDREEKKQEMLRKQNVNHFFEDFSKVRKVV